MKKFEFHLQKLLSYKEQLLDGEMMNLAVLNNMLDKEEKRLAGLFQERDESREEFNRKMMENLNPADYNIFNGYEKHMKEAITKCKNEIEVIKIQIEEQVERVKELKVETKSLETLKEARYEEYKKEAIKKEETLIDEFESRKRIIEQHNK